MRKKILVVEKSDAIRGIAESLLHQNGFDVISATDSAKARELIVASEPNMLIIGADIKDDSGQYLYEQLESNPQSAKLPIMIISSPENESLPYPPEVVLPRPFEPEDFIERVKLFVGAGEAVKEQNVSTSQPLESSSVDDDFLDNALGIDRIEVEESEEMDKTHISQKIRQIIAEKKKDIYDIHQDTNGIAKNDLEDTGDRVESLMIRDDSDIQSQSNNKKQKDLSSSGIDISNDQYGLIETEDVSEESEAPVAEQNENHDYDWFIDEMKKESADGGPLSNQKPKAENDSGSIHTTPASDVIEPLNTDSLRSDFQPGTGVAGEPEINSGGVDQFINEFKKEVEQLNANSESNHKPAEKSDSVTRSAVSQETIPAEAPQLDSAEIHHYVSHMVEMLAERVAKNIVDRIDKDELYQMLKDNMSHIVINKE